MRILVIGNLLHNTAVKTAAQKVGAELYYLPARQIKQAQISEKFDVLLAATDHGNRGSVAGSPLLEQCRLIVPLSGENIAANITTLSAEDVAALNAYFAYSGPENLKNAFLRIRQLLGPDEGLSPPPPCPVPLDAIYTFDGPLYRSAEDFFQTEGRQFAHYVGMLGYRSRWADGELSVEKAIADSLARRGIGVIPAFSDGSPNAELGTLSFRQAVRQFFCQDGKPVIDLLINFQFFGSKAENGRDMFATAAKCFEELDIPVIRPAGLREKTVQEWRDSHRPYAADLSTNFIVPELQGIIEPIHIFCTEDRQRIPVPDRVERITGRIQNWLTLRHKDNSQKHIALILHNAPCAGVEATVSHATDLDGFQSAVDILHRLKDDGYAVTNIPESGDDLRELIFSKKAFSDFRWTAVEDIAESGGVLYAMTAREYHTWYDTLSEAAHQKMESSWGKAPGEAMVLNGELLITGISFGNVLVMVQPKRGCYGAKCTGEVCKILQDPACPPTHQYLASYWYLQHNWKADAVIHLGTHGSLEYLPGKNSGLSGDCFPDIAIGDLINLYPYNVSVVSQALIARRRSYAVTLSYLPAPGKGLDPQQRKLAGLIGSYFSAREHQNGQAELIREDIEKLAIHSPAAQAVLAREPNFDAALLELRTLLAKTETGRRGAGHRAFGAKPDRQWIRDHITELWLSDPETAFQWHSIEDPLERADAMCRLIDAALDAPSTITDPILLPLVEDARTIAEGLEQAEQEMESLLRALSGKYISPTRGGDSSCAGREILPTGRNIHGGEQDKVPTPSAYERGRQAAADLLELYRGDEGKLPDKVAMNMTSLDVTRTDGEQLGQFMALLGVRPVWSAAGHVDALECIPLNALGRPRIDVTVHISSVMRDAWPEVLTLMDRAVQLAANQDEPDEMNHVRANSKTITQQGEDGTGRIFGGRPGTYTSAVGLALKASAWKSENDLAKYFIDSSSYLYGENKQGVRSPGAFAANIQQVDLTSDITSSRRTDAIASSYSARVQGGFSLAAKALGSKKTIRQYMGESTSGKSIRVVAMSDHVARAIEDTLLNDVWKEQMMEQGYQGAADLMCRVQNIFDTQCVCENIASETLDAVAKQYLLDEDMQRWFQENNPYALEESSRRFLELKSRDKWDGDPEVLRQLQRAYLKAEGDLEDSVSGLGDIQAGNVDIIAHDQIETWSSRLKETEEVIGKWKK